MKRTLDDLRGALHDEADASAYPDVDALVAGAWQRVAATRRRRLAVLGAVTVALLVVGGMATTRLTHQTLPQPAGKGTCGPTANPTPSLPAIQSTADALVYGIEAVVAALPIGVRVQQLDTAFWPVATSQAPTPEGLWLVSRADVGAHPELAEYGELLLLTPDRTRILSAYPFRGVPPQWLLVTPQWAAIRPFRARTSRGRADAGWACRPRTGRGAGRSRARLRGGGGIPRRLLRSRGPRDGCRGRES